MLQQSIITIAVGAWFEKNLKVCFFEENHYSPLLKVAICYAVLVSVIFVEKLLLNAQK